MGRQRTFDTDAALERMMFVFWRKGFDGTTLSDLTDASGVQRPSLYAAFGNKEEVFEKVVRRYVEGPSSYLDGALAEESSRRVAERALAGSADLHTAAGTPPGCLMVNAVTLGGDAPTAVEAAIVAHREDIERRLAERFEAALAEGDLGGGDPASLAAYLRTVIDGMAVRAAGGADREELGSVIELAMLAWPTPAAPDAAAA